MVSFFVFFARGCFFPPICHMHEKGGGRAASNAKPVNLKVNLDDLGDLKKVGLRKLRLTLMLTWAT